MWDAALRIRNLFLKTPLPGDLYGALLAETEGMFGDRPVAVPSSAPGEDSAGASFAGLYESFLNVRDPASIVDHVLLVWASLWSDGALLYRQEMKLDVAESAMAVVVQELAEGDRSGVAFSMSPTEAGASVVEAVWGLNQGLVDGTVQPDRWVLERSTGRLREHAGVDRLLGRVERLRNEALREASRRRGEAPAEGPSKPREPQRLSVRPRQLVGQPAGPGLARGVARVVGGREDLMAFKAGEILVCDAIDPNMTFVVPLCSGIVERRGGMLIHGAIVAREYGLACVTGVPDATALIHSGDTLTVDGYLGIVVVHDQG